MVTGIVLYGGNSVKLSKIKIQNFGKNKN